MVSWSAERWSVTEIEKRADLLAAEAVAIWPRPELPESVVSEFQQQRDESDFSIEDHPNLLPPQRRALFERLSAEAFALDPSVTRQFLKSYVAFRAEMSFVDVVPQKARILLVLNIPLEALHDERGQAWDVSTKGHLGNGPTEVDLDEDSDFTYVMGLVRQAFEYQMGGD